MRKAVTDTQPCTDHSHIKKIKTFLFEPNLCKLRILEVYYKINTAAIAGILIKIEDADCIYYFLNAKTIIYNILNT